MGTSRRALLLVLVSIVTASAQPQEDDETGSGSGSGSAIVAPKDPKARGAWLAQHMDTALTSRPALAKAKVTAYAVDLSTGAELYAREADHGMNLASNAKLLTSFAALGDDDPLVPEYRRRLAAALF